MKINPIFRVGCIVVVLLVNFFGVVVLINITSSLRIEQDQVKQETQRQENIRDNAQTEIQRKLNDDLLIQQHSESMQKILGSETLRLSDIQDKNQQVIIQ
jgi:hypothetical protein